VDIGSNDGFFSIAAAQAGANVTAIELFPVNIRRMNALARYLDLEQRVTILDGHYPQIGTEEVKNADIVICLGLFYHLDDLVAGLRPMTESNATLIIEGMFHEDDWPLDGSGFARDFDPCTHRNNELVCSRWLSDRLTRNHFEVRWLPEWQKFVEQPGNLRHPGTRKMLIASPSLMAR
jgi:hypothetical protein